MKANYEIHPIQVKVLRFLLFHPAARFGEMNLEKISTDHFNFHLQSLVDSGLLAKSSSGEYSLTTAGKEFANRFDTDNLTIERQPKIAVAIGCFKKDRDQILVLIQQRLKNPYYGFHGFVTGKVRWGETVFETAAREIQEETGLSSTNLKLAGLEHKMDYDQNNQLLEDKCFFLIRANNLTGDLKEKFEGGKNLWVPVSAVKNIPNLFDDVLLGIKTLQKKTFTFSERKFIVKTY